MKATIDRLFTIFNAIIPIIVITFIWNTRDDYIQKHEYNQTKNEIFARLDHVETLLGKILTHESKRK